MLALNGQEILLIYMSLGETFSTMRDFSDSEEYDAIPVDVQEYVLTVQKNILLLYKKMSDFLEKEKMPFAKQMFDADTKPSTPSGMI